MNESKFCNCLYFSTAALGRIFGRIAEEEFASTGLSPSYAFLLLTVNSHRGIGATAISEQLLLTPSTVTRLLEKMENKGYIIRKQTGREINVFPTKKSKELDKNIKSAWKKLNKRFEKLLSPDEVQNLTVEINRITKLINNNIIK